MKLIFSVTRISSSAMERPTRQPTKNNETVVVCTKPRKILTGICPVLMSCRRTGRVQMAGACGYVITAPTATAFPQTAVVGVSPGEGIAGTSSSR